MTSPAYHRYHHDCLKLILVVRGLESYHLILYLSVSILIAVFPLDLS